MTSNSAKMTLEEKIVEKLKTEQLSVLVDDEAALLELTERAIREYLFKQITITTGYNTTVQRSPVVQAAERAASTLIETTLKEMLENPEIKGKIQDLILTCIPSIIMSAMQRTFAENFSYEVSSQISLIKNALHSNGG